MPQQIVKISSIIDLASARLFSSLQVDWIGINLDPLSEDYMTIEQAKEIKQWLAGPKLVVELANRSTDEAIQIIEELAPDLIQINDDQVEVTKLGVPTIAGPQIDLPECNWHIKEAASRANELLEIDLDFFDDALPANIGGVAIMAGSDFNASSDAFEKMETIISQLKGES